MRKVMRIVLAPVGVAGLAAFLALGGCETRPKRSRLGSLTQLHIAAMAGDANRVKYWLREGIDVNSRDKYGDTPLCYAAQGGHLPIVRLLLARGAVPDDGSLSFAASARENRLEMAKVLIDHGAEQFGNAMIEAIAKGHEDVVRLFLQHGANVKERGETISSGAASLRHPNGVPPLHMAARGRAEIAKLLIEHGAGVNDRDTYGYTALHFAALSGERDVAKLLLAHGAGINARSDRGATPLKLARERGRRSVAKLLADRGGTE